MNWKSPNLNVLGLDRNEKAVLLLLEIPMGIQQAARKSPIPRTTIGFTVNNLMGRNLIERIKFGKRFKYYSVSEEKIKHLLGKAVGGAVGNDSTSPLLSISNKKVSYYHGLTSITKLQIEFLSSFHDERVYAIQPNKSWLTLHSKVDDDHVIQVNDIIKSNKLIIEGIIEHDAYQHFKLANKNKKKFAALTKSFQDRMADYAFAPKGFLTGQVEMWIIKNTLMFLDWQEEVAIKITDQHVSNFLKDMFMITKEQGKRIDHNQSIREVLAT
jgi:hypothetical protein